ncbi:ABC transporter ATP-binding protein [Bordetella hinzii]|uniref:ABC transporter ATP-binding protein n=2 Tax=Bordetella hinzii TaxID=103855 RepID=A0AAN1RX66_9BORD|nr:ABC transporter ATP-binding protein [Bordetella hinzii]AKQ57701.1 High-affinity branched-chain amino acid transport ATP-binding protein LivF [Bordetella hinzii]AKQ62168.1 High-affinity branched-chain amino acid transport ATP-binding protein LivF [Bordetella hinzii]AZW16927.1 ABC transporter ATP-binding protein [Bordetella hinzii]KCB24069.1 ABC transporter, ATP-binding protein [Bordetella hinzii OH87 BAL007II]KCB28073.1 ABC transporter, ATP-binding protein [Bordetella hinzii CA90 BAL1384]
MLKLENIVAGYGRTRILHGVTLNVPKGGLVALLGGNGTGKSTTLKTIAGLVTPQEGQVLIDGRPVNGVPAEARASLGLSLVPQGKEVFGAMSVEENLLMGAYHRRGDRGGIASDLEAVYQRFKRLRERRNAPAGMLSGGERQMLSIGRSLMARPSVLLLDEPSAALAPKVVEEIADAIIALRDLGLTLLLVEQNVGMALDIADYIYVIRGGRIAYEREVGEGVAMDELREFYLGGKEHG